MKKYIGVYGLVGITHNDVYAQGFLDALQSTGAVGKPGFVVSRLVALDERIERHFGIERSTLKQVVSEWAADNSVDPRHDLVYVGRAEVLAPRRVVIKRLAPFLCSGGERSASIYYENGVVRKRTPRV